MPVASHQLFALLPSLRERLRVERRADFDLREQVRQATDIVALIGSYLELRRQGRQYVARCPWHDDRKPSLTVNQERQSWKCWVCNIGGDVFQFVMKKEGLEFRPALELLAEKAGIPIGPTQREEPGSPEDRKTLLAAHAWAEKCFHDCLLQSDIAAPARNYLAQRGLTSESIARFRLGFAPLDWSWLIERARFTPFSPEVLHAAGLLARSSQTGKLFDFFRGRVLFPIHDVQDRPIAFGARVLPETEAELRGKYINTPDTKLFNKSEQLYGLSLARETVAKSRNITVVEGYTDVMMAHQCGATDVVAVLGTALTERHIRLLKRFADRITLVLDGDAAGQRRTNEILELFVAAQVDLQIATLPEEFDPCELLLERGLEAWQAALATSVDALEHRIRVSTAGIDLVHDVHRANQALEEILATFAKAPADALQSSDAFRMRQQQMITQLARRFRVSEADLRERLRGLRTAATSKSAVRSVADPLTSDGAAPVVWRAASLEPRERELLELLCLHPTLAITALQEIAPEDLPSSPARDIFATYRSLEEQGSDLDFSLVLSALENEQLQALLVEIDEVAAKKEALAVLDPITRLRSVLDRLQLGEQQRAQQEQLALLEEQRLDSADEASVLQQMLELNRRRMGLHLN